MAADPELIGQRVQRYLATYLTVAPVQPAGAARTDTQLHSLIMRLAQEFKPGSKGTLIDVGCGEGALLERLSMDSAFTNCAWEYAAVDTADKLDMVARVARERKLNRRVEPILLEDFYAVWPDLPRPHLVFCRNVLHELDIKQTSQLLVHVTNHLVQGELFVIQDLMNFVEGERHNACWFPDELAQCMQAHGFASVDQFVFGGRGGARWFNLVAAAGGGHAVSVNDSVPEIVASRTRQWQVWLEFEKPALNKSADEREVVEALDLDVQLAALTRQLKDAGQRVTFEAPLEKRLRARALSGAIDAFVKLDKLEARQLTDLVHFRERGEQLTRMEDFLRGEEPLALVWGGNGSGKTTFVTHLLAVRAYEKCVVLLDGRSITDLWSFVEAFFAQVGLRLSTDVLGTLQELGWGSLEVPWRQFVNRFAGRLIVVLDNLHRALDSNGLLQNRELAVALQLLVQAKGAKVIVTQSRSEPSALVANVWGLLNPVAIQIGRFGSDQTVINVLDDRLDRKTLGIDTYPERLLQVIDRHPLAARLAADVLRASGKGALEDERFLIELQDRLFTELWTRLVDEASVAAVDVASRVRIALPRRTIDKLGGRDSVAAALSSGAIYGEPDRRWVELLSTLAVFRTADRTETRVHESLAEALLDIYREDDDPKWIRESYFHRLLSSSKGAPDLNRYYAHELVASAGYLYRRREYGRALEIYEAAHSFGSMPEDALMRRASCLIRRNKRPQGEAEFAALFVKFPKNLGIKQSYIAALLAVNDAEAAEQKYEAYFSGATDPVYLALRGRIHMGRQEYDKAETIFSGIIGAQHVPEAWLFAQLARALMHQGAVGEALGVLKRALGLHAGHPDLLELQGAAFERMREAQQAETVLIPLFKAHPERTAAALSLAKVYGRDSNSRFKLRGLLERARKHAAEDDPVLLALEVEVLKGEDRPEAAVDLLRKTPLETQHDLGMLAECTFHLALKGDAGHRKSVAAQGLAHLVPPKFNRNVQLLVNRARLAVLASDAGAFQELLGTLATTRIDKSEVEGLRRLWAEHNPK
jgi:tetratricopeptide (TPR) repeat protein